MHRSVVQHAGVFALVRDLVRWNRTNAAASLQQQRQQQQQPSCATTTTPPPRHTAHDTTGHNVDDGDGGGRTRRRLLTTRATHTANTTLQLCHADDAAHATTTTSSSSHSSSATPPPPPPHTRGVTLLDAVEAVVRARYSCRSFDTTRSLDAQMLARVLAATTRAATAYNLQPWHAIVVRSARGRAALSAAALSQPHVRDAAAVVVFAADTEVTHYAPLALEAALDNGYYTTSYGARYLRNVYYHLHAGPCGALARCKNALSAVYSARTRTPLLTVPETMTGYAWKQAMLPATTFTLLCTAAGWQTCMVEGFDEAAVRAAVQLPTRFTVAVLVCVGYAASADGKATTTTTSADATITTTTTTADAVAAALLPPGPAIRSPRFATRHLVRYETY